MPQNRGKIEQRVRELESRLPVVFDWFTGNSQPRVGVEGITFWEDRSEDVAKILMRRKNRVYIFTAYPFDPGDSVTVTPEKHAHRHATSNSTKVDVAVDPITPYSFTWSHTHLFQRTSDVVSIKVDPSSQSGEDPVQFLDDQGAEKFIYTSGGLLALGGAKEEATLNVRGSSGAPIPLAPDQLTSVTPQIWLDPDDITNVGDDNNSQTKALPEHTGNYPNGFVTFGGSVNGVIVHRATGAEAINGHAWVEQPATAAENSLGNGSPTAAQQYTSGESFTIFVVWKPIPGAESFASWIIGKDKSEGSDANGVAAPIKSANALLFHYSDNEDASFGNQNTNNTDVKAMAIVKNGSSITAGYANLANGTWTLFGTDTNSGTFEFDSLFRAKGGTTASPSLGIVQLVVFDGAISTTELSQLYQWAAQRFSLTQLTSGGVSAQVRIDSDDDNYTYLETEADGDFIITPSGGKVGINISPAATLHALDITEQLRLGYDPSNYTSFTVDSGGDINIVPTGQSVGIMEAAPTAALHITKTARQLQLAYDANNEAAFAVNSAGELSITVLSKLGIGTITPKEFVTLETADTNTGLAPGSSTAHLALVNTGLTDTQFDITFRSSNADAESTYASITGLVTGSGSGGQIGDILFGTKSAVLDASLTERIRITSDGHLRIASNGELRFADNGNYVGFKAPALDADQIWVLPDADGNSGESLQTDGSGNLSWAAGLPAGSEHDVLVHDGANFVATTTFTGPAYTFDGDVGIGTAPAAQLHIIDVAEQLRVGYDASNYLSMTVRNDGEVWMDSIGGGPGFRFFDNVGVNVGAHVNRALSVVVSSTSAASRVGCNVVGVIAGAGSGNVTGVKCAAAVLSSSPAADCFGGEFVVNVQSTPLYTADQIGGIFRVKHIAASGGSAAAASLVGGEFTVDVNTGTSKTVGHCVCSRFQLLMSSGTTNTVDTGYGVRILTPSGVGHTMTTAYGVKLDDLTGIPAITTYYGMRIGDQTDVSIANNDAIYIDAQDGANKGAVVANLHFIGDGFDEGHPQLNDTHIYPFGATINFSVDEPTSDTDYDFSIAAGFIALPGNRELRFYDNTNYVGFEAPTLSGNQIWVLPAVDGATGDVLVTDGAGTTSWIAGATEKAWSFNSPSAKAGTYYFGGYYDFASSDNDFNPSINWGTVNSSYAAHFFVVAAAGASGGTDTVIRITGTSIDDQANRVDPDTEDLTLDDAGAAGAYYETSKKWIGQIAVVVLSGPDLLCNYGWCKYWDNSNSDFKVVGLEVTWRGGAADAGYQLCLRHHRPTGWTYNVGSAPSPPSPVADLQTDHNTEYEVVDNDMGAWKRDDLSTDIDGSGSEGTIWEITTTANRAIDFGNILMRITMQ